MRRYVRILSRLALVAGYRAGVVAPLDRGASPDGAVTPDGVPTAAITYARAPHAGEPAAAG